MHKSAVIQQNHLQFLDYRKTTEVFVIKNPLLLLLSQYRLVLLFLVFLFEENAVICMTRVLNLIASRLKPSMFEKEFVEMREKGHASHSQTYFHFMFVVKGNVFSHVRP